jgi:hypothetical protein
MSGVRREASVKPIFSGAFTEWLPTLGVSWQIVQLAVIDEGTVTGPDGVTNVWLFRPGTPVMTIGFVVKSCSPRAIERLALSTGLFPLIDAQMLKIVKEFGSNGALVGFKPTDR